MYPKHIFQSINDSLKGMKPDFLIFRVIQEEMQYIFHKAKQINQNS